ncbi:MAG: type II toxin-antitoxin system VapC family toxin [Acetobacteraceae bacterium]
MPFVLDASVAASWAFADESAPIADSTYERIQNDHALVPSVWWFEVRNTLIIAERRARISASETASFLRSLRRCGVTEDRAPVESDLLMFTRRHRLTVYDAAYLELAYRIGLELATLAGALVKAARAEGVSLVV